MCVVIDVGHDRGHKYGGMTERETGRQDVFFKKKNSRGQFRGKRDEFEKYKEQRGKDNRYYVILRH